MMIHGPILARGENALALQLRNHIVGSLDEDDVLHCRVAIGRAKQALTQVLREDGISAALTLPTLLELIELGVAERRRKIAQAEIAADGVVEIGAAPVDVTLVGRDDRGIPLRLIMRENSAPLAGGQDFRNAEAHGADRLHGGPCGLGGGGSGSAARDE